MIHLNRRKYPYMEEVNLPLLRQLERLPERGRLLDVGCGRGALGEALEAAGWQVWGVERDAGAARVARERLTEVLQADLCDVSEVEAALGGTRFDALVFSDVLEHLYDPRTILEAYLRLLRPGGWVAVSVPNAVVWSNRLSWLVGRVEYADTGVMDRTHIRFFTFRTACRLIETCGCEVLRRDADPHLSRALLPALRGLLAGRKKVEALEAGDGQSPGGAEDPRAILDSRAYRMYKRWLYPIEHLVCRLWPGMLAFRIVLLGRVAVSERSAAPARQISDRIAGRGHLTPAPAPQPEPT